MRYAHKRRRFNESVIGQGARASIQPLIGTPKSSPGTRFFIGTGRTCARAASHIVETGTEAGGFGTSAQPHIDRFGRPMDNLRVSVTQRCGMACEFCHAEGQMAAEDVLSPEQIETVVRVGAQFGVREVKLSGGEPTLRRELVEIVERSKRWVDSVSMVTTGYTLPGLAGPLAEAGLDRVNISVHSPDDETHARVVGAKIMDKVKRGIAASQEAGLAVRLNMTIMKGVNDAHWR